MTRVAISVEGKTEEEFVKNILAPGLEPASVYPEPILLGSGGNVTVERLASDMSKFVWNFDFVTSLVDFYGFRDKGSDTREDLERRIKQTVISKITRALDDSRIFPYVQQHEFEALLFSDVRAFSILPYATNDIVDNLTSIRSRFDSPEDINDSRDSAPSKRIVNLIPRYQKVVDGSLVADEIGLEKIRAECPRFDEWVTKLESLGDAAESNVSAP